MVHFHKGGSNGIVKTAHNRGVVTRRQVCDDRRFPSVTRSIAAVSDIAPLIACDDPADDRVLPVII